MQNLKNNGKKVCLINLGCKVNKYEIDSMANILSSNGYQITYNHEFADYYILATCAVTNESEKKSRQYITKLLKFNPKAKIIVCGCASQNNPEQFKRDNVISIIGTEGRENILDLLEGNKFEPYPLTTNFNSKLVCPHKSHTRAYIKIQDGCNNFCSYCIIPYLRGRNRSRSATDIVSEAETLSKNANEIVLTGIDVSSYGDGNIDLGDLIIKLKNVNARIRLSSFEVRIITKQFLEKLKQNPNFCPHFHLSLQSGSTTVLKRMNRHYTAEEYLDRINLIRSYYPNANITTDIIVGFPKESDNEFLETVNLCNVAGFGHVHIFPYSVRNGTNAAKMVQVNDKVKKERTTKLIELCKKNEQHFYKTMLGKTFTMLTEEINNGYMQGYTENYIKVLVKPNNLKPNMLVKVKLLEVTPNGVMAEIV